MDEQQVDILRLQLTQALVDTLGCLLFTGIGYPNFRHQEQILALQSTLAPSVTNAFLILIGLCRIYQSVAYAQSIRHATLTLIRAHEKHAVAQCRHLNTV